MNDVEVRKLLQLLLTGEQSLDEVQKQLQDQMALAKLPATSVTTDARVDIDRARRCGFPEVVYCSGKSEESVVEIFEQLSQHGQDCLGTRASEAQASRLVRRFPDAIHDPVGRTVRLMTAAAVHGAGHASVGPLAVITAGTSDAPVAREALETLRWMRCEVELYEDVGVAGPHRLLEILPDLQRCCAVVVAAGMEGALPSVVGGHLSCPVVAVPTSVGYGASFGGVAALLGMLNSCASNVTVVNIDGGFKAGYVAGMIARQAVRISSADSSQ